MVARLPQCHLHPQSPQKRSVDKDKGPAPKKVRPHSPVKVVGTSDKDSIHTDTEEPVDERDQDLNSREDTRSLVVTPPDDIVAYNSFLERVAGLLDIDISKDPVNQYKLSAILVQGDQSLEKITLSLDKAMIEPDKEV